MTRAVMMMMMVEEEERQREERESPEEREKGMERRGGEYPLGKQNVSMLIVAPAKVEMDPLI